LRIPWFHTQRKTLTYEERCQIEALKAQERPLSNRKISKQLDPAPQTIHIHIEVKNGTVRLIWRQKKNGTRYEYETFIYSTSAGQAAYEKARQDSTKQPKWSATPDFMAYADHADQQMKREKPFSDAVVGRAKKLKLFPPKKIPRTTTLYNYIYL
jgi:IS30 family transposase